MPINQIRKLNYIDNVSLVQRRRQMLTILKRLRSHCSISFIVCDNFVELERIMPRKVSKCHWELMQIIQKVAEIIDLHIIDYVIQYGCDDIDSFSSSIYVVNIHGKRDGQKIRKEIIVKWHSEPKQRSCFRELYHRDHVFNKIIVPKMLEIQNTFKIIEGLRLKFPNCIHTSVDHDEEVIVFSHLQGFRVLCSTIQLKLDHAILALKKLAKLHALSFVWKVSYAEQFTEVKSIMSNDVQYSDVDKISNSMKHYYECSINAVIDPVYKERLKELAPNLLKVLKSVASPDEFSVICHGDCWRNNLVFKYKGSRPVEVLMVDYQLSRYTTPVADISYFLYMSSERGFLFDHYESLLGVYYGTLAGVLRQCNLQAEKVYPTHIFKQQLKEYSVLGLIEALISMKIITADSEDAIKMAEMKYNEPDAYINEYESKNQNIFIERVNTIVDAFFHYDYSLTEIINKDVK